MLPLYLQVLMWWAIIWYNNTIASISPLVSSTHHTQSPSTRPHWAATHHAAHTAWTQSGADSGGPGRLGTSCSLEAEGTPQPRWQNDSALVEWTDGSPPHPPAAHCVEIKVVMIPSLYSNLFNPPWKNEGSGVYFGTREHKGTTNNSIHVGTNEAVWDKLQYEFYKK